MFERKARELEWPRDKWHLIAQNAFKGKALAFSVLSDEQARDYDQIKQAVLRAYEITSEAHRQKFRSLKKEENETYAEFIAKKPNMFDRWLRSEEADSKEKRNYCDRGSKEPHASRSENVIVRSKSKQLSISW